MIKLSNKETILISGGSDIGECSCERVVGGNAFSRETKFTPWELGDVDHETCGKLCCGLNTGLGFQHVVSWRYKYHKQQLAFDERAREVVKLPLVHEGDC